MAISPYLSIITLTVNGLNAPIKRYRGAEWIQKQNPYIYIYIYIYMLPTKCRSKDTQSESEGMEKGIPRK